MTVGNETSSKMAILRLKQVVERTKLSKSTIYNKLNPNSPGYDPTFPQQCPLGASAVGWLESEIGAWVARQANKGKGFPERAPEIPAPNPAPTSPTRRSKIQNASAETRELLDARIGTIRKLLEERAKRGALVRYTELMERTMLSKESEGDWQMLDAILTDLSRETYKKSNVLLAAHVRNTNDPKILPRESFFDLAIALGLQCDNKAVFLDNQIKELFGHYCNPKFRTEQPLFWTEAARTCFAKVPGN